MVKQPVTVSRMGKGDLFGEVLAFSKGEYEYSVITSAPTTLFALHHEDVDMYLTEEHLDRLKGQVRALLMQKICFWPPHI